MRKLFKQKMLWVLLLVLLGFIGCPRYVGMGSWNLNRLVGSGWGQDWESLSQWCHNALLASILIFILGYGIKYFKDKKTTDALSIIHIVLLILWWLTPFYFPEIVIGLGVSAWIIFILNMFYSGKKIE